MEGGRRRAQPPFTLPASEDSKAQSYLLMREMQSSAWLRRGELLRLLRLSPSLTRDCSTLLHEAAEGGQASVGGGQGQDEEPAARL